MPILNDIMPAHDKWWPLYYSMNYNFYLFVTLCYKADGSILQINDDSSHGSNQLALLNPGVHIREFQLRNYDINVGK